MGLIQIENIQNAFAKEIKNGFEVKEKRIRKIKEFKKVVKFIFENLSKFLIYV